MLFSYEGNSLKSGIYEIRNRFSNKSYIGQAKEFKERWMGYKRNLPKNKCHNKHLQNSFNEYYEMLSHSNFLEFHILEIMDNSTKEERNQREEWWIKTYKENGYELYNFREKVREKEKTCYSKHNKQHHNAKTFKLLSPDGTIYEGENITQFCEKHNLRKENITAVLNGRRKNFLGWRDANNPRYGKKKSDFKWTEDNHPRIVEFKLKSPSGEIVIAKNVNKFCRDNKLNQGNINAVLKGQRKSHKGWALP